MIAAVPSSAISAEQEGVLPTFAETVETHKAMVYSILWHFLRDRSLAEELAQEVFLELHQSWKSVKSSRHLVFWLRRVTTHRAIDLVRKRKIRPEMSLEESGEPTALEQLHDSFLASYLGRMVASLPEKQRMLVVLRYQEEMELEEIARVLGMNVSTVKTQIGRALELLRAKMTHRLKPNEG